MTRTNRELKLIFAVIVALFAVFLAGPILILLGKSLWDGGLTGEFYASVLSQKGFLPALGNSFAVAGASAAAATLLAFLLAALLEREGEARSLDIRAQREDIFNAMHRI